MKIFLCDNSYDGFYTAVFNAIREKDCLITSDRNIQISIDSEIIKVSPDRENAKRVKNGIIKYDKNALNDIDTVLRSNLQIKEQTAFNYIKKLIEIKKPILSAYGIAEVVNFNNIIYKITGEIHRLKGLLRFTECASGAFYAPYAPDNNITDLLMPHFIARFKSEKFIIHDVNRKIAGIYNGAVQITARLDEAEIYLSENEKAFENLWKKYYNSVNIKERPHEKQMKGSMPVRYWKFLPEKNI